MLQLFPWMGPDPVPELHRGVKLIIRSVARMAGRQHSKKHSHNKTMLGHLKLANMVEEASPDLMGIELGVAGILMFMDFAFMTPVQF